MAPDDTSRASPASTGSHLARLNDLDEFQVADGYPDIRGWPVRTGDGGAVGTVGDLIVDLREMRVRYLDVELDRALAERVGDAATPGDQEGHTLIPIGRVQLDDANDHVRVEGYSLEQLAGLPRYGGRTVSGDYERSLVDRYRGGATDPAVDTAAQRRPAEHEHRHGLDYAHADYDEQRPFAGRRRPAGDVPHEQRLTLAEERLDVGTRTVPAGDLNLHKRVETERVQEHVELRRDDASVERRTVTDPSSVPVTPQVTDDEIRIPVLEERLVVTKVLVPREEIIVRKHSVTERQTVEADLRRERLDIDDTEARRAGLVREARMTGAEDRATDGGPLDRAADRLDDVKDRVDGNPASRPGPDPTDRRL